MDKKTLIAIKKIIQSKEFTDEMLEAYKLLDCVKKVIENKNIYALKSLKKIIDNRINELNIQTWFNRINFE